MTDEELAALQAEKDRIAAEEANAEETARAEKEAAEAEKGKKADEKNKLTDSEAKALKDLMKWKEKARAEEAARKELESKYGDIDLEAARNALREADERETKDLEKKGEYERLLAKQREAADAKIKSERKAREEAEARVNALTDTVNKLAIGNSFANSKFIHENLALTANKTQALYATHFDIEDGRVVAYDAPKGAANRTPIVDARGEPVSFDEALEAIINSDPDKDYLIKSTVKPGAGSKAVAKDNDGTTSKKYASTLDKLAAGIANPKNFGYERK